MALVWLEFLHILPLIILILPLTLLMILPKDHPLICRTILFMQMSLCEVSLWMNEYFSIQHAYVDVLMRWHIFLECIMHNLWQFSYHKCTGYNTHGLSISSSLEGLRQIVYLTYLQEVSSAVWRLSALPYFKVKITCVFIFFVALSFSPNYRFEAGPYSWHLKWMTMIISCFYIGSYY